jgi:hypothetical protein
MRTEQLVAVLEDIDARAIRPARSGDLLQLGIRGDCVTAKLADTGRRLGEIRSAQLVSHIRRGGRVRGMLEKSLSGAMVVCTLIK